VASYPENTKGIIEAINACTVALGGIPVGYTHNTGGIIQALIALEAAIGGGGGGGGGSSLTLTLDAGEDVTKGDAVYISGTNGKVYKAESGGTREEATVIGLADADAVGGTEVAVVMRGKFVSTGTPFSASGNMYLDATAGGLVTTVPTSGFNVLVGEGLSTTDLDVRIQTPIELT